MLSDFERKLLRILYNVSLQRRRMPSMEELERKSGRAKHDIKAGLEGLELKRYITWEDKRTLDSIVILEGWERQSVTTTPMQKTRNTEYWTNY